MNQSSFQDQDVTHAAAQAKQAEAHVEHAREMQYTLTGRVQSSDAALLETTPLEVLASIDGVLAQRAPVDAHGGYSLSFRRGGAPAPVEMRLVPRDRTDAIEETKALIQQIPASAFTMEENGYISRRDLPVAARMVVLFQTIKYHVHGLVLAQDAPFDFSPLSPARLDFFTRGTPSAAAVFRGSAFVAPNGSYTFDFTRQRAIAGIGPNLFARVFQPRAGGWQQVYETPVEPRIPTDVELDILVPGERVDQRPDPGVAPQKGFRWAFVGKLPLDPAHVVGGYVSKLATDGPNVPALDHQPLCATLELRGLFGNADGVRSYTLEVAKSDASGKVSGGWTFLNDSLHTQTWSSSLWRWVDVPLGPDPATHRYQNIDGNSQFDWPDRAIKARWDTTKVPEGDGKYVLRITGFGANGKTVVMQSPVMHIANAMPSIEFDAGAGVGTCGDVKVPVEGGTIPFVVTGWDPNGHVRKCSLSGTRGRNAEVAGAKVEEEPPGSAGGKWTGLQDKTLQFTVADRSGSPTKDCPAIAYSFRFEVTGSATNCDDPSPWQSRTVHLVVSKP